MKSQGKNRTIYQVASLALGLAVLYTLTAAGCTLPRSGELAQNCTSAAECDDGTPCTDDACGGDGFCVYSPVDNTGSVIQVPHDCKSFICNGGRQEAIPDDRDLPDNPCTDNVCNNGTLESTPKAEGAACALGQGNGTCEGGECIVRGCMDDQAVCNDDNGCTVDTCDQQQDQCVNTAIDGQPAETDIPNDCNIILCVQGVEQEIFDNNDIEDDNNLCTTDSCEDGNPVHTPLMRGTACGANGVCNNAAQCVGCNLPSDCGSVLDCSSPTCIGEVCGVQFADSGTFVQNTGPCTELQCDGNGGTMSANKQSGAACNDGQYCTQTDLCNGTGNCIGMNNPCPGPDNDNDCSETCNESGNNCNGNDPPNVACDDTLFCNGTDTCNSNGSCNQHTGNPCAGPNGDSNCNESCTESGGGNCNAYDGNGAVCVDGVFCNGADTCQNGTCSGHAGDPCPGPNGDNNCNQSCTEAGNGSCTAYDGNGAACSDNLFCNGADTCQSGTCSGHAGDPCPGADDDGDCNESCTELGGGNCNAYDGDTTACNDTVFCNGADQCSGGGCNTHAGNPCAGHNVGQLCNDSCTESSGGSCTADDADCMSCCNFNSMGNDSGQCISGVCSAP